MLFVVLCVLIGLLIGPAFGWFYVGPWVCGYRAFTRPGGRSSYLPWRNS